MYKRQGMGRISPVVGGGKTSGHPLPLLFPAPPAIFPDVYKRQGQILLHAFRILVVDDFQQILQFQADVLHL